MRILLVSCRENTALEVWTSTDKTGQKGRMTLVVAIRQAAELSAMGQKRDRDRTAISRHSRMAEKRG